MSMSSIASKTESLITSDDLPERLSAALIQQPQRRPSLWRMSPELSYGRHAGPAPTDARHAAVMLLLFRRDHAAGGDRRWHLPITERPSTLHRHGGQMSLPGGTIELGETSEQAARRELREELGLDTTIQMLGRLTDCYVFASNFVITPWIAVATADPCWQADQREVQQVVEMPLEILLDNAAIGTTTIHRGPLVFHAPCYHVAGACIWGATGVILSELAGLLRTLAIE
jgi:8-oxo-dGTP pyrophosphatase MutT (NUDIX family)